mgnify:CR=1 FL=1
MFDVVFLDFLGVPDNLVSFLLVDVTDFFLDNDLDGDFLWIIFGINLVPFLDKLLDLVDFFLTNNFVLFFLITFFLPPLIISESTLLIFSTFATSGFFI